MANLIPAETFDNVYQLEVTDQVRGGAGGISNTPSQNLTNRTQWLKARALASVRTESINQVAGAYGISSADIGEVISVHDPSSAVLNLPDLASFPKGNPLTIVITDVGSANVPLNCHGSDVIDNFLNDGSGVSVYSLAPGTRIVIMATVTSWVVIFKTSPVIIPIVTGFAPGDIVSSASPALTRDGFLLCDGSNVSRTTYANLFTAIGVTYGSGDGSTTFRLPDHRDLFLRTWNGGVGYDPGRSFGDFQQDTLKDHEHNFNKIQTAGSGVEVGYVHGNPEVDNNTLTDGVNGGDGGGLETRPKNISVNTFIKY